MKKETTKKQIKLDIYSCAGAEYTAIILDDEETRDKILELAEEEGCCNPYFLRDLSDDDDLDGEFRGILEDSTYYGFGPVYCEDGGLTLDIETVIVEVSENDIPVKEVKTLERLEDVKGYNLVGVSENLGGVDEDIPVIMRQRIEKRVHSYYNLFLDLDEEFELSNLFVISKEYDFNPSMYDEVITDMYYITEEEQIELIKKYSYDMGEDDLSETIYQLISEEYDEIEEILREKYGVELEMSEGKGEYENDFICIQSYGGHVFYDNGNKY